MGTSFSLYEMIPLFHIVQFHKLVMPGQGLQLPLYDGILFQEQRNALAQDER